MVYPSLLPSYQLIDITSLVVLLIVIIGVLRRIGAGEFPGYAIRTLRATAGGAGRVISGDVVRSFLSVLFLDVTTTRVLRTCRTAKWFAHIMTFWGFIFLAIATTLAYFFKPEGTILPLTHPVKLFGNVGGALLVLGLVAMFFVRFQQSGSPFHFTRADFFLTALLLTGLTGFATQQSIYAFGRAGPFTTISYWTHMVLVTTLLVTAPYSKFIHALYKPSWLVYDSLEKKIFSAKEAELLASSH